MKNEIYEEGRLAKMRKKEPVIVIDDLRYSNEADLVRELGGVIYEIKRPRGIKEELGYKIKKAFGLVHASERGIDRKYIKATIINDGTIEDLQNKVRELTGF
jgi:hypothetical protein